MTQQKSLSDEEITRIDERMRHAFEAVDAYFGMVRDEGELPESVRGGATAARNAVATAGRDWPRIVEDWRQLRRQVTGFRRELSRIEQEVGDLWRSVEEEEEWPAQA